MIHRPYKQKGIVAGALTKQADTIKITTLLNAPQVGNLNCIITILAVCVAQ
jgi:hypothetical protein